MAQAQATILQEINGLYVAVYGRAADGPGIDYWCGQLGITAATAASTLVTPAQETLLGQAFVNTQSTYFNLQYGALTDLQFIQALYVNIGGNTGDANGVQYWFSLLQTAEGASPSAAQILAARAGLVGQFVHDMLSIDLTGGQAASGLSASDYAAAVARQQQFENKVAVSQDWANESRLPGVGAAANVLLAPTTSSPAFIAAQQLMANITSNSGSVVAAENAIAASVAAGNLNAINAFIAIPPVGNVFTLTTGLDAFTGNGTFNAADVGALATWTAGDSLTGTGNNNVFNVLTGTAVVNPSASTVTGIQTANITSGISVVLNTTAWTGLTALSVTTPSIATVTAAATTAVTVTDATLGASAITVNGGLADTVTDTSSVAGGSGGGTVTIGTTTAPAGAVVVNSTVAGSGAGTATGGAITIKGGTTVAVNETLTQATVGATTAGSPVTVTGTAITTAVSVSQTAAVANPGATTAADAVTFSSVLLTAGQSVTVAGLTFTVSAGNTASQTQIATAFAGLASGATSGPSVGVGSGLGAYSGTLTGFSTAALGSTGVTLTASAAGIVTAPVVTGSVANAIPVSIFTNGTAALAAITDGTVTIADANAGSATVAATITNVSLTNYGTATISSNALNNLTLTGPGTSTLVGTVTTTEGLTTPTNTTLALTVSGVNNTLTDASNQFKTINITTGAVASKFNIVDTALTTVSIGGTGNLTQDYSSTGGNNTALTSITDTTTGTSALTLSATQGFVGTGSGKDNIGLAAISSATITGSGTGASNSNTLGLLLGFSGTQNMTAVTNFSTITDLATGTLGVSKVLAGTALTIAPVTAANGTSTAVTSFTYATSDSTGAGDSVAVTVGAVATNAATTAGQTVSTLILTDNAGNGIGTVGLASSYNAAGMTTTISNLDTAGVTAAGISALALTGNAAFAIGAWTNFATALVIADTSTSTQANTFTLTDNLLTSITVSGSATGATTVNLSDSLASAFSIVDSIAGAVTFSAITGFAATSLTVTDTSAAALTIAAMSDAALATTTLTNNGGALLTESGITTSVATPTVTDNGSGAVTITALALSGAGTHTIGNSGSGAEIVSSLTDTVGTTLALTDGAGSLTVSGSTAATTISLSAGVTATLTDSNAAAITVTGSSDNQAVSLAINSAGAVTETIALGNGNDTVTMTGSNVGTITNLTIGSGTNAFVEVAAHTGIQSVFFAAANGGSTTSLTSITGWGGTGAIADTIHFLNAPISGTVTNEGAVASIAAGVAGATLTSGVTEFNTGTNSYFYEYTGSAATSELVAIVGSTASTGTLAGSIFTEAHV
jgi:S-layer protein